MCIRDSFYYCLLNIVTLYLLQDGRGVDGLVVNGVVTSEERQANKKQHDKGNNADVTKQLLTVHAHAGRMEWPIPSLMYLRTQYRLDATHAFFRTIPGLFIHAYSCRVKRQ